MTRRLLTLLGAAALTLAAAACGSSSTATHPAPAATTSSAPAATTSSAPAASAASTGTPRSGHVLVTISNYMYMPAHLTVVAGTKVSFHNNDAAPHTATALNTSFDTGTITKGQTKTVVLKTPGTYRYHCLFHAFMVSTITVVPAH